ncbi:hypothetical protein ACFVFI_33230 [Streptomyces sp. NPDC057705]|uniref:hypothetical protein n=1 Tax=Streptomyces sp. NPDC057705 TaxID=3346222 RepID=UPI00367C348F
MPSYRTRRLAPLLLTGLLATGGATLITGTAHATPHTPVTVTTDGDTPDTPRHRNFNYLDHYKAPGNDGEGIFGGAGGNGGGSGGGILVGGAGGAGGNGGGKGGDCSHAGTPNQCVEYGNWMGTSSTQGPIVN